MDLLEAPELADYLMDRFTDFYVAYFDRMFTAAAGRIDILRIADDLGTQHGLLISPRLFDRYFAPRLAKLVDMAHSHGVKVMFHSCGAIVPFIERIISLGVDILDPLQVAADGMDPQIIKTALREPHLPARRDRHAVRPAARHAGRCPRRGAADGRHPGRGRRLHPRADRTSCKPTCRRRTCSRCTRQDMPRVEDADSR